MTLSDFLGYLSAHNLINLQKIKSDDDDGFYTRLKTHKYVYFAQLFGLKLDYIHNVHLYGPYSDKLAIDCSNIDIDDIANSSNVSLNFDEKKFIELLKNKDSKWLELASTIIDEKNNLDKDDYLEYIAWIKSDYSLEEVKEVYSSLQNSFLKDELECLTH